MGLRQKGGMVSSKKPNHTAISKRVRQSARKWPWGKFPGPVISCEMRPGVLLKTLPAPHVPPGRGHSKLLLNKALATRIGTAF